jgi:hypothetical protein
MNLGMYLVYSNIFFKSTILHLICFVVILIVILKIIYLVYSNIFFKITILHLICFVVILIVIKPIY